MEFQRSQSHSSSKPPEILDIETLMKLDEMALNKKGGVVQHLDVLEHENHLKDVEKRPGNLICQRCFELKHMHERLEYKPPPGDLPGVPTVLAHHVHLMDRDQILSSILDKMYFKSIVIKVIDMANFEGSQIPEIYENVNLKKHRLLIVCNKIDALPKGMTVERVQTWVKDQLKDKIDPEIRYSICLVSAKEATGI